ncbi:MAG: molybdopterin-binding protein [Sulfolobales archaeon]|nr:molybdopterin-binding protein [Sulfolobales archaeon]MCX8208640.1 molybdopterin-binding protein [Sulfolobales archaeon]MDW8010523.1 molybdopterin-binding protein [Sulfolobales archaeon]
MSIEKHRRESQELRISLCVVVTSDKVARGVHVDEVVPTVSRILSRYNVGLGGHEVVPNDRDLIIEALARNLEKCDVVLVSGGTGLGPRDVSVDVVRGMCSKDIPGFGELFRYITFQIHGSAALATRAIACAVRDKLVFVTPGSPAAVELALDKLVLPEIRHLVAELRGLRR